MTTIESRADIELLVRTFYTKIRSDALLGPIFNAHLTEEQWPVHLDKLTDFWEANLFGVPVFKGSPTRAHVQVDYNLNHTINQAHFAHWLKLWEATVDQMYTGERAARAKQSARNMAVGQFVMIWRNRPEQRAKRTGFPVI
ncbi:MAG: group III truncated hemoglobin [Bacteroidota bacterium]